LLKDPTLELIENPHNNDYTQMEMDSLAALGADTKKIRIVNQEEQSIQPMRNEINRGSLEEV